MTAMIEAAGAAGPVRLGERQADGARQARWLLDLEQALLEQGLKPYRAVRHTAPGQASTQAGAARERSHEQESAAPDFAAGEAAAAQQRAPGMPPTPAAAEPARMDAAATASTMAASGRAAVTAAGALRQHSGTDGMAGPQPGLGVELPGAAGPRVPAAPALAQAQPWTAGALTVAGQSAQQAADADGVKAPAVLRAEAPAPRMLGGMPAGRAAESTAAGEAAEASPPPPQEAAGEPFEKKLLHLYYGRDGIHAWLRDAELQAGQMRSLAQALATELGGEGRRLASLTVNGRKVDTAPALARRDDDMAHEMTQDAAPATTTTRSIE